MGRCVGWMLAWQGKMNFIDELQSTAYRNVSFHQQTSRFTLALHGTLGSGEEMEDQHSHYISHPARVSKIALTQQYSNYSVVFLRYVL